MAITNYGELKTAVANWLDRSDFTLRIPEFIAIAQSRLYLGDASIGLDPLRIRDMVTGGDIAIASDGTGSIPAGWLEFQSLYVDNSELTALKYIPAHSWRDYPLSRETDSTVLPTYYTVTGNVIRLAPVGAATIKGRWYGKFSALSADSDTDWILTNAPHVYLYGALFEARAYMQDPTAANDASRFSGAVAALNNNDRRSQTSGGLLVMMRPETT